MGSFFRKELIYVIVIMFGSFYNGTPLPYYSSAGAGMRKGLGWSENKGTWFSTVAARAAIIGGPLANIIIPRLGRKIPTFIFGVVGAISWILVAATPRSFSELAFIARVLMGIAIGGLSSLCSMYIVEIAPDDVKSSYGALHQFGVTVGIAYVYLLGIWCSWRLLTWLCVIPPVLLCVCIWFIPESPAVIIDRDQELRGDQKEYDEKEKESLFQTKYIVPIFISCLVMFFQQFSGINAIITNLSDLFEKANVPLDPNVASFITGIVQCISTLVSCPLIDKLGRRIPFIISSLGQAVVLLLTWASDLWNITSIVPLICIFLDLFFFGIGSGPIPWFIVPELFPVTVRHIAVSISTGFNWFLAALTIFIWPEMQKTMGYAWGIFFFAAVCVVSGIYGIIWMKEPEQEPLDYDGGEEEATKDEF